MNSLLNCTCLFSILYHQILIVENYFAAKSLIAIHSFQIHCYDGSRMIPLGRPARRFGIIYVSAQLVNMVDNSSLDLQNVCCSGISRTEDECGKATVLYGVVFNI